MSPGAALGAMTLGQLIAELIRIERGSKIWFGSGRYRPTDLSSYRGYYEDLALGFRVGEPMTVDEILAICNAAVNGIFEGYKGGSYRAREDTAIWASRWGEANGNAIVAVEPRPSGYELVVERIDP